MIKKFFLTCEWLLILCLTLFSIPKVSNAVSLTYGITVCTEAEELKRLLKQLSANLDETDKIVIQIDESNSTPEVEKVIEQFKKILPSGQIEVLKKSLNDNFAEFKNNLLAYLRKDQSDFVFLLDADEYLSDPLMKNIKWYLSSHDDIDCLRLARANYYSDMNEHPDFKAAIKGRLDDMGRLCYMDEKTRILNLKKNPDIRFEGKVHEELTGCRKQTMLPYDKGNCWEIIHVKNVKKQMEQNKVYARLQ